MSQLSLVTDDSTTRDKGGASASSAPGGSKGELIECKLCLTLYPEEFFYQLQMCGCRACEQCMTDYVEVMLNQGQVLQIPCPIKKCAGAYLQLEEVKRFLDEEAFTRFLDLKYLREVEVDPSKTFCPRPGCENVCSIVSKPPPEYERKITSRSPLPVQAWQARRVAIAINCSKCQYEFCSVCKTHWHASLTCEEANARLKPQDRSILFCTGKPKERNDTSQKSAKAAVKNENIVESFLPKFIDVVNEDSGDEEEITTKPCPVCALPIERDLGCAKIHCVRCNHIFCWNCLELLDEDFLWLHYESGPCKDRMGIPRAQVHTYRLTAILTMAGIGVLILIASPAIIVASPCLLCYKFGPKDAERDRQSAEGGESSASSEIATASDQNSEKKDDLEQKAESSASNSRTQSNDPSCSKSSDPVFPLCKIL